MSYGYGASGGNLLAEARNHRAVGTEHIAKACGNKLGRALDFALRDCKTERLHVDFGKTLGTAHYIGGIHSLIGRNHHHFLYIIFYTLVCNIARANHIDKHSLTRVLLHEGHMLIGGSVEHHLRLEVAECEIDARQLAHIADYGYKIEVGEASFEFEANLVHRSLGIVE